MLCIITLAITIITKSLLHIITSPLHYFYIVITKGKSCNTDYIITCNAKSNRLLLHYYYVLLRHYYAGFYRQATITHHYLFQSPGLADDTGRAHVS